jgi:SNF2 family DNA or RNA helicase
MDFALPGLLGNCKEFRMQYQEPLKSFDSDIESMGNHVRETMGQYFLRRLKQDVAKDLPHKSIRYIECEMSEYQKRLYQNVVAEAIAEKDSPKPKIGYMLTCLQQLKSISDHPLLGEDYLSIPINELVNSSAKMKALLEILNNIKSKNDKVIIFADRRDMQQILKRVIRFHFQIECHIINGETPTTKSSSFHQGKETRLQAIQDFQRKNGFNVIIMSPIAAGMGLNVVGANHVIHYSRHWNPAKENQATDRVYRIGQDKDVYVYYPITTCSGIKSFDENLDDLLKRKSQLADATLFPSARIEISCEELFNSVIGK